MVFPPARRGSAGYQPLSGPERQLSKHEPKQQAVVGSRRREKASTDIQQFMMRLSSNLRRYRWAVFAAWLLVLAPAVLVSLHESNKLTGGGF